MRTEHQQTIIRPAPDFEGRYKKAILRQGEPDRVPLSDFSIDAPFKREFLRRELGHDVPLLRSQRTFMLSQAGKLPLELEVEFWYRAGFDFISITAGFRSDARMMERLATTARARYDVATDEELERGWAAEGQGAITSWQEFESFPWSNPEDLDYWAFEEVKKYLPPGMKVQLSLGQVFTGVWWLMGLEGFARATRKDPDLIKALYEKVGAFQLKVLDIVSRFDCVGSIQHGDDLAYAEGLMVRPQHFREHFFPWLKTAVDLAHSRGLPFIFHSDGDLRLVLDDIVACGVDAIHPIEPKAMDIVWVKQTYGDRVAVMGNIDMGYTLTQGTPEEVDAEVKLRIRQLAPGGGYLCGSSNSLPEYVPIENFIAMRNAIFTYGRYPIQLD
ncbi:MAG: hypothetical protein HY331_08395 [Chloroflexi bacterium]|nr:hypothetical protein [Chloroflexota bacterium]